MEWEMWQKCRTGTEWERPVRKLPRSLCNSFTRPRGIESNCPGAHSAPFDFCHISVMDFFDQLGHYYLYPLDPGPVGYVSHGGNPPIWEMTQTGTMGARGCPRSLCNPSHDPVVRRGATSPGVPTPFPFDTFAAFPFHIGGLTGGTHNLCPDPR